MRCCPCKVEGALIALHNSAPFLKSRENSTVPVFRGSIDFSDILQVKAIRGHLPAPRLFYSRPMRLEHP